MLFLLFFLFLSAALSAGGVHYHPIFLTSDKALVDRTMQRLHCDIHYFHYVTCILAIIFSCHSSYVLFSGNEWISIRNPRCEIAEEHYCA